MIRTVDIEAIEKALKKAPKHIVLKFRLWVLEVEQEGIAAVQKHPGWRDHALKGNRSGQRAIYLNKQWRAVYVIEGSEIKIVKVIEVHPHDY